MYYVRISLLLFALNLMETASPLPIQKLVRPRRRLPAEHRALHFETET